MKVLFLDIDGVILPGRAYLLPNQTKPIVRVFDPCAVSILNTLCEEADLKIVVHSSWLRYPDIYNSDLVGYLVSQGVEKKHFHDDPLCEPLSWRYDRIRLWLSRHPEVKDFVIIDDTPLGEQDGEFETRFYLTDFDNGLTMDLLRKVTYDVCTTHTSTAT